METRATYCRICHGTCGIVVGIEDGQVVQVRGDSENVLTRGFTCPKGRHYGEAHHAPGRLLSSLRRDEFGNVQEIDPETAMDEVAGRLQAIIAETGPESVAFFVGTQTYYAALTFPMARAFWDAVGSPKWFGTMTIDQSAKWIAPMRMGRWEGGPQSFDSADVWLLSGNNPLVSLQGGSQGGTPISGPYERLREAKQRGLKLIVIDPRRTETAARADVHLQPVPGSDPHIFAGIIRLVLAEGRYDADFCARNVDHLDEVRAAVDMATPEWVAERAGIPVEDFITAARMFGDGPRGMAAGGTGTDMARFGNVAEHLIAVLNAVCGRYAREGEPVAFPRLLGPSVPLRAQVPPPYREWEHGFRSRIGNTGRLMGEVPSNILADEILEPGPDRVRALIVCAGNPANAIPDQRRVVEALRSLDLLVTVDARMSETARLAHYVVAPTLGLERPDHTHFVEAFMSIPFAHYTEPVLPRPPGVIEDWQFYWGLARRMGLQLTLHGQPVDMETEPASEELLELVASLGSVPLSEVKGRPHGRAFDIHQVVLPPDPDRAPQRLQLLPPDVAAEVAEALAFRPAELPPGLTHHLVVRRAKDTINSFGKDVPGMTRRSYNPAYLNPADLEAMQLSDGQPVEVRSEHDRITAIVHSDPTVRTGVVSMTHGWGALPDENLPPEAVGANPSRLIDRSGPLEPINRMPRMTGIPVALSPLRS